MKIPFTLILPAALLIASCAKAPNSSGFNNSSIPPGGPTVTTLAGTGSPGALDGTKQMASFNGPTSIAIDQLGYFYVSDSENNAIRRISPQGVVNTIAGNLTPGFSNKTDSISFSFPTGIAVNAGGNYIYVADAGNNAIRLITDLQLGSTLAGNGSRGYVNASDTAARFYLPTSVAIDSTGNVYVVDDGNNVIRKISSKGAVTTLAGTGSRGNADGTGTAASFNQPTALCVDAQGNVYVADTGNNEIRKITPQGAVTTLAGNGTAGLEDGKYTVSEFNKPQGIALDGKGNLFVGDTGNNVIRKISVATGSVVTFAGSGQIGANDSSLALSTFNSPEGLVIDTFGRIIVCDTGNNLIRIVTQD
jgi:DNA-binding beta-propeller fold protein YncE